ncbi:group III truncated hemoglobin [Lewinella cohaerens]|uniref:group III truncated hemoglobin n=1 Tax=Lewinella cohaerens TaxID=70995 RepID=UPI0003716387|nr:group III truncated hemoglobin [Lewinella cohaerens]
MKDIKDISSIEDIRMLVDTFYEKIRQDDLLGEVFNRVIQDRWGEHLEKMYRFWQTVLLKEHTYYGSPFPPHAQLPVEAAHFDRWKQLFFETVDEYFVGEKATEAKWRAGKMAEMFQMKISYYQNTQTKPLM